jgi:hypothetical protein
MFVVNGVRSAFEVGLEGVASGTFLRGKADSQNLKHHLLNALASS